MAEKTDEEIIALIDSDAVCAVSVDTNVIEKSSFKFSEKPLSSLRGLEAAGVQVLFPDVIKREVVRHIADELVAAGRAFEKGIREYKKAWAEEVEFQLPFRNEDELLNRAKAEAENRWRAFIENIRAQSLDSLSLEGLRKVMDLYFDRLAPFDGSKGKKHEFPDALCLIALEEHCDRLRKYALVVSGDKDWDAFCRKSNRLILVQELAKCLDYFNHTDHGYAVALREILDTGEGDPVYDAITDGIRQAIDGAEFDVEADSHFSVESESVGSEFILIQQVYDLAIIESDEEHVAIHVELSVLVRFEAYFHFSKYDSIDHDEIGMGSSSGTLEELIDIGLVISVSRAEPGAPLHIDAGEIDVQITWPNPTIDFGEVEPDWSRDYDDAD